MKQEQINTQGQKPASAESLQSEFENIKQTQTTRVVSLIYRSCCGCGCDDVHVYRRVNSDSPLKNGDRISSPIKGDSHYKDDV